MRCRLFLFEGPEAGAKRPHLAVSLAIKKQTGAFCLKLEIRREPTDHEMTRDLGRLIFRSDLLLACSANSLTPLNLSKVKNF